MRRVTFSFLFALTSACVFAQVTKQNKWLFTQNDGQETLLKLERVANEAKASGNTGLYAYYRLLAAEIYEQVGNVVGAERALTELVALGTQSRPSTKDYFMAGSKLQKTWFDPMDQLAFLYVNLGNFGKAKELFQKSRVNREAAFGSRSVHRILPIAGLGVVAYRTKDQATALKYFGETLALLARATTTGYDFDNVARYVYSDAVELYLQENRFSEAGKYLDYLTSAASGRFKYASKGASKLETARVFELMARYQIALNHDTKAQQYLDRGLQFMKESQLQGTVYFKLIRTQGLLLWKQGRMDEAAAFFTRMAKEYRAYLNDNFSSLTEYEREQLYHSLKSDFETFYAFTWDCHQAGSAGRLGLYEAILESQWEIKGLLLGDLNYVRNYISNNGDAQLQQKFEQLQVMRARLSSMFYQKDTDVQRVELQRDIEQLEKQITQSIPTRTTSGWSWRQVQSQLKGDELGLELLRVRTFEKKNVPARNGGAPKYFKFEQSNNVAYVGLMLRRDGPVRAFGLDNGSALEGRPAKAYRNRILAQIDDNESYKEFWLPLRAYFAEVRSVYFAPDGVYSQINVNTLKNPETNKFVIDELEVNYVSSLKDLATEKLASTNGAAVLVGRPEYDLKASTQSTGFRSLASQTLSAMKDANFGDLPATELEVSSIEQSLKGSGITIQKLIGSQATESSIKRVQQPRILHLATHGFFIPDTSYSVNPMIRSGLILAGVKGNGSEGDDGILTAYETSLLNLQGTELVVLSACETGLGETRYGEGVYGLQRAVIAAGAKNLLMSFWKVDDEATRELMSNFFLKWSQDRKVGKDFREAQQQLRQQRPHPYYWGAFILLGK